MTSSPARTYLQIIYRYLLRFNILIFLGFMTIALLRVWLTRYVPSLDGPQHLYNANVIRQLLTGDDLFREFFRINPVIVGYWTGHFLLGFFKLFLPAWLAEKFLLTTYVFGMYFSFRYLVRSMTGNKESLMTYLIFPFMFHTYLLLGYYTFSLAAIFFFWAFGYYIRVRDRFGPKEMLLFGALSLGVFLSHALVFLFFGVAFILYYLAGILYDRVVLQKKGSRKPFLTQTGRLLLSVLPALILWFIYVRSVMDINDSVTPASYTAGELFLELLRIRQLVGFNHEVESKAYSVLFAGLVLLTVAAITGYVLHRRRGEGENPDGTAYAPVSVHAPVWAIIALVFLAGYFLMPDRISAGSLTHRFGLYFFLCWIICLASLPTPNWVQIGTVILLLVVTGITRKNQVHFLENLNRDIADIQEMNPYMEDGSTVISVNASPNWIHTHFQLYTSVDKKLVHLNNPQCAGQFPVIWNGKRMPECFTGSEPYRPGGSPDVSGLGHRKIQVDYITLFHWKTFWEDESNARWQQILSDDYELVMTTTRDLGALYRRNDFE